MQHTVPCGSAMALQELPAVREDGQFSNDKIKPLLRLRQPEVVLLVLKVAGPRYQPYSFRNGQRPQKSSLESLARLSLSASQLSEASRRVAAHASGGALAM